MKVLLDGCVWSGSQGTLRAIGHDVESTADWPRDPGDDEVLAHAFQNSQVLITLDKDFGELAVVLQRPHVGIIRLVDIRAENQGGAPMAGRWTRLLFDRDDGRADLADVHGLHRPAGCVVIMSHVVAAQPSACTGDIRTGAETASLKDLHESSYDEHQMSTLVMR